MTTTERALWRKRTRATLLEARMALGAGQRKQCSLEIAHRVVELLSESPAGPLGLYWPVFGEPDLLHLADGRTAVLPVVVERGRPLAFRRWARGEPVVPGIYGIPYPEQGAYLAPEVLLVPLVGFDAGNYRLGYGGGYYDRTLAAREQKPLTIGVGFELARLPTIYPQPYDVPLDWIVTEASATPLRRGVSEAGAGRASR